MDLYTPSRRIKTNRFSIKLVFFILFLILFLLGSWGWWSFKYKNNFKKALVYHVEKGSSVNSVISDLAKKGIISNSLVMKLYLKIRGWNVFIAGSHNFSPHADIKDISRYLVFGNTINNEQEITIIEGWNKYEIADYLEKEEIVTKKDFLQEITHPSFDLSVFSFIQNSNLELEGYLYPDTYKIVKGASASDIIKKMLTNFGGKFTSQMLDDSKKSILRLSQIITLASIVELEASSEKDRRMIADVFLKRLELGMPLQSDATVNYVTGKSKLQPTFKETAIKNPYNTYQNTGLPPTPVSNPSITSIRSVIYPVKNPYYYFLTTKGGDMVYSRNGEEHLRNKAKYLD